MDDNMCDCDRISSYSPYSHTRGQTSPLESTPMHPIPLGYSGHSGYNTRPSNGYVVTHNPPHSHNIGFPPPHGYIAQPHSQIYGVRPSYTLHDNGLKHENYGAIRPYPQGDISQNIYEQIREEYLIKRISNGPGYSDERTMLVPVIPHNIPQFREPIGRFSRHLVSNK